MRIVVPRFHGMLPQAAPRKLAPTQAQRAANGRLWSGDLKGIQTVLRIEALSKAAPLSVYPWNGKYLNWQQVVDVVTPPLAELSPDRRYYTGHYNPKVTDADIALAGPDYPSAYYRLGVPAPDTAPTVGITGGSSGTPETRSYLYTFVTAYGEEGPPSDPTEYIAANDDATQWDISDMDGAPPSSFTITAISLSAGVLTCTTSAAHFLESGEQITIGGVTHYSALNGTHAVTRISATQFSIASALVTLSLVTNGVFDTDTDWTKGDGWSIGTGVASCDGSQAADSDLEQDIAAEAIDYVVAFTVSNYSAGAVTPRIGGAAGTSRSSDATFTETITATGTGNLQLRADASFIGDVDDVSAEEAPGNWTAAREAPIQTTSMVKRLYRTDAAGVFRFVADIAIGTATYTDTVATAALGEAIPSTTWIAPPGDMHSLRALPNGFMVGASGRELCFCEPSQFHAWPEGYRLAVDFDIVGLGVWGGSIVVCTTGVPYLCTGATPANMSLSRLDYRQACVSKRSIVEVQTGVMYASKAGLMYVGAGGPRLATEPLMERQEWALYNPSSIRAALYDDRYYGFYEDGGEDGMSQGGFVFDPQEPVALFGELSGFYRGLHSELEDDTLYVIEEDGFVGAFDEGGAEEYTFWKSKVFTVQVPVCFQAAEVNWLSQTGVTLAQIQASIDAAVAAVDARKASGEEHREGSFAGYTPAEFTVAGGPYTEATRGLGVASFLTFILWAYDEDINDFVVKLSKDLEDNEPFRIPGGYEADEWYFELSGNQALVHYVLLAESMEELAEPFAQ
jgi:hypothetical protein